MKNVQVNATVIGITTKMVGMITVLLIFHAVRFSQFLFFMTLSLVKTDQFFFTKFILISCQLQIQSQDQKIQRLPQLPILQVEKLRLQIMTQNRNKDQQIL